MEKPEPRSRKVGIYDRPASADRARYIRAVVLVIAIVLGVIGLVAFFNSQADRRSSGTNARMAEMRALKASLTSQHELKLASPSFQERHARPRALYR
jgi:ABC-type uncharacterized transport system permease subunit